MDRTLYDWLFGYYGVDWLAMICTAISAWKLGNKHNSGWIWGIAANLSWIAFNLMAISAAGVVANIVFGALNARGLLRWIHEARALHSET